MLLSGKDVTRPYEGTGEVYGLSVFVRTGDTASQGYINAISRKAPFPIKIIKYHPEALENNLIELIDKENKKELVAANIIMQPLPPQMNLRRVAAHIPFEKDVDGLHFFAGGPYAPCTAEACVRIIDKYGFVLDGANVTVIGRSRVVGLPAAYICAERGGTVTLCHSHTRDLQEHISNANIIISAAGQGGLLNQYEMAPKTVIIDAGYDTRSGTPQGDNTIHRLDCHYTPLKDGVGAATTEILIEHTLRAIERHKNKS